MTNLILITNDMIDSLIEESKISRRKRALNLLRSSDKGQTPAIMLNALQNGTYVTPHQHPTDLGNETFNILRGYLRLLLFDDHGDITGVYDLSMKEKNHSQFVEIPSRTYHSIIVMEPDSVISECYHDVYSPETYKKFASWAPEEKDDSKECVEYLEDLLRRSTEF